MVVFRIQDVAAEFKEFANIDPGLEKNNTTTFLWNQPEFREQRLKMEQQGSECSLTLPWLWWWLDYLRLTDPHQTSDPRLDVLTPPGWNEGEMCPASPVTLTTETLVDIFIWHLIHCVLNKPFWSDCVLILTVFVFTAVFVVYLDVHKDVYQLRVCSSSLVLLKVLLNNCCCLFLSKLQFKLNSF